MSKNQTGAVAKSEPQNRNFRVTKGQVGPWPHGHVFSEAEFRKLHPIPETPAAKAEIEPDTYHPQALQRLMTLGVIEHAPDMEAEPAPLGPEANPLRDEKNLALTTSITEAEAAKAAQSLISPPKAVEPGTTPAAPK